MPISPKEECSNQNFGNGDGATNKELSCLKILAIILLNSISSTSMKKRSSYDCSGVLDWTQGLNKKTPAMPEFFYLNMLND
jgi:hypothetical protein